MAEPTSEIEIGTEYQHQFTISQQQHDVWLKEHVLQWRVGGSADETTQHIELKKVLAVEVEKSKATACLVIHHITPQAKHASVLLVSCVTMQTTDKDLCDQWAERIKSHLSNTEPQRPKRLLVFINPNSGGCKAVKIYEREVAPLFALAGVETEVIVTKDGHHAPQVVESYDLTTIDGIIIVSGDGTFMLIYQVLLIRTAKEAGIDLNDLNDPEAKYLVPSIPVGFISGGTLCMWAQVASASSSTDVTTSAIHIITGAELRSDILSLYNDGKLLAISTLMVNLGYIVDFVRRAEKRRWMGFLRMPITGLGIMLSNNARVDADVEYLPPDENPEAESSSQDKEKTEGKQAWAKVSGSFSNLSLLKTNLQALPDNCDKEMEMKLYSNFNGYFCINMAGTDMGRLDHFRVYQKVSQSRNDAYDHPSLQHYKAKAVRIHLKPIEEEANEPMQVVVDGELLTLTTPLLEARVHPQILRVYGVGFDERRADLNDNVTTEQ